MQTRRDFLRSAAALTGGAFVHGGVPDAIARALAINPAPGTTFRDAEHVVILMQENRSFDHAFGALRGVRGFRDPRAHVLPNGNRVWFQTDARGDTHMPFHLDIAKTNATWIGGLPHTWPDQVDARNGGKHDAWLIAKPKRDLPFTLGHYARQDIPFYYSFADAFTVCDQAFCSSLTGTSANRLFLWSGAIRRDATEPARVLNSETTPEREGNWTTFPERLDDAGVSWRVYQNEISYDSGLKGDSSAWLGGFTDNPLEWFGAYNVRHARSRRAYVPVVLAEAPGQIAAHEQLLARSDLDKQTRDRAQRELDQLRASLDAAKREQVEYTDSGWASLSPRAKALHEKAFTTNVADPRYRSLTRLSYRDGDTERELQVPAGDVLHQFREDVSHDKLPAVSWLVAPENFSDHPSAPWFGAWYVSETLDILTKNPDVWRKTILILCYDENDGYFDHVPPFTAPHPARPETGKVSAGIDTSIEWATVHDRESAIGLGYRVPLVVASPWSRGGCVNSQVFDHTSMLRFLETWLGSKGTAVKETNISSWRRTICGDLTSAFRPYDGETIDLPRAVDRDREIERIHSAKFRPAAQGGAPMTHAQIAAADVGAAQEKGTRPSCPLPYELVANGQYRPAVLDLIMEARSEAFGAAAEGAPFNVYSYHNGDVASRTYAVAAGGRVLDSIPVAANYNVRVDGPNGFMRHFVGGPATPAIGVSVDYGRGSATSGRLALVVTSADGGAHDIELRDESYAAPPRRLTVGPTTPVTTLLDPTPQHGWYDFSIRGGDIVYRYAGRVETGAWSITDPAMG